MTDLERYLVEEVATDFADGHFSRREAMRRLGLLGVEAIAAASLLSACGGEAAPPPEVAAPVAPEVAGADHGRRDGRSRRRCHPPPGSRLD